MWRYLAKLLYSFNLSSVMFQICISIIHNPLLNSTTSFSSAAYPLQILSPHLLWFCLSQRLCTCWSCNARGRLALWNFSKNHASSFKRAQSKLQVYDLRGATMLHIWQPQLQRQRQCKCCIWPRSSVGCICGICNSMRLHVRVSLWLLTPCHQWLATTARVAFAATLSVSINAVGCISRNVRTTSLCWGHVHVQRQFAVTFCCTHMCNMRRHMRTLWQCVESDFECGGPWHRHRLRTASGT